MLRKLCVLSSLFFAFALVCLLPGFTPLHISLRFHGKESSCREKSSHLDSRGPVRRFSGSEDRFRPGDLPLKKTSEPKYGNQIYYAETSSAQPELHFDVEYDVIRHERVALGTAPHLVSVALTNERA